MDVDGWSLLVALAVVFVPMLVAWRLLCGSDRAGPPHDGDPAPPRRSRASRPH